MDLHIINAITKLREGKKKPSKEEIFSYIRKRESITDEVLNGEFESLLSKGSIYDKYEKNSYYVAEIISERIDSGDIGSRNGDIQQTDDNDLINMIKNVMFNETLSERKNMEDLRLELKHKNDIINTLLHNLTTKENTCNTLIETMLKNKCNHNICDMCKIKESSRSNNINQTINHPLLIVIR